jgi:hypothetical protein
VVKGQATNEVLGQTGWALYTRVTNVLTTWPLSGQHRMHRILYIYIAIRLKYLKPSSLAFLTLLLAYTEKLS